jgi:hypothetical protein
MYVPDALRQSRLMCREDSAHDLPSERDRCTTCTHLHPHRLWLALARHMQARPPLAGSARPDSAPVAPSSTLARRLTRRPPSRVPPPLYACSTRACSSLSALAPNRTRSFVDQCPRRRLVLLCHLLKWYGARRRQMQAMGDACAKLEARSYLEY